MVVPCRLGREGHQEREPEELQPKGIGRECCGRSGDSVVGSSRVGMGVWASG